MSAQPREQNSDIPKSDEVTEAHNMLKKLETQSGGSVKITHDEETETKKHIDVEERFAEKIRTGRASSVLFVCVMFIGAVAAIMFISPMVLLINNKEQLTNDLNDGLYAYYTYSNKVLGGQLGAGCDEETIQCKFKTMSPMLKERFERYGFTLTSSKVEKTGRYKVTSMLIPNNGGAAADEHTLNAARKNAQVDALLNKVYSSRTGVYQDKQFYHRLLSQFGLEQANTLSGETVQEFDKSFDNRVANGDSPRYSNEELDPEKAANTAGDGTLSDKDSIDKNGRGVYSLQSLSEMTNEWRGDIYTNLVDKANTHLSLACAFATYGNLAENAVVRAKMITIARYAMNYMAVADEMKTGTMADGGGEIAVESLATKLTKANSQGKNAMDADGYRVPALGEQLKDRAAFIKDLTPLQLLAILKPGAPSLPGTEYLKGALTTNIVQNAARDRTAAGLCAEGMSGKQLATEQQGLCWTPASYPLAQYIGVAAGAAVAAARDLIERILCPASARIVLDTVVKPATRPEATATLPERIKIAAQSESNKFTAATTGVDAQNIIFAGTGILLGDRAQSLGMRPASIVSLTAYLKAAEIVRQETETEYRSLARTTPWDATNPYSFLGSIVAKLAPADKALPTQSWRASASTLLSALPISFVTAVESSADALYTQPMHFQPSRLQPATACGILGGFDADIMPDFACNVRYSMSLEELTLGIQDILDYMTKPHPDNVRESLNEVNARDVGADEARGEKMKKQAKEGAEAAYIDKKTGKPNKYTEYAKFLEYCTNRHDPWGGVGMAVELKDPPEDDDEDAASNSEQNTSPLGGGRETNYSSNRIETGGNTLLKKTELEDSYYALGWGSKKDQDWYTGKQCTKDGEMMKYFRGYTMACALLASMSGTSNCWEKDAIANGYDDFYTSNNIIFQTSNVAYQ